MNNNKYFKTNYIPRGQFDKNFNFVDESTQKTTLLGHFKDNFSLIDKDLNNITNQGIFMSNYAMHSYPILYSRQIYEPTLDDLDLSIDNISHTDNFFKLSDPIFGSNLYINPFNAQDLYKDSIYLKIKNSDINPLSRLNKNN